MGVEWLDACSPCLSSQTRAIPLQLLCITVSVGYRRQTASAVHHVVNVRRFLSYLPASSSLFLLPGYSSFFPVSSLINAFIRLAWTIPFQFLPPFFLHVVFFPSSSAHRHVLFYVLRSMILLFTFFLGTTSSRRSLNSCFPAGALTSNCTSSSTSEGTTFPLLPGCLVAILAP